MTAQTEWEFVVIPNQYQSSCPAFILKETRPGGRVVRNVAEMDQTEAPDHRIRNVGTQKWPRWSTRRRVTVEYKLSGSVFSKLMLDKIRLMARLPCKFFFSHPWMEDSVANYYEGLVPHEGEASEVVSITNLSVKPRFRTTGSETDIVADFTLTIQRVRE